MTLSRRASAGFSAAELLIVLAISGCIAAMGIPATVGMVNEFSLSGDAHGVSNTLAQARLSAAANFTRSRLYVDRAARSYRIERSDRRTWVCSRRNMP